MPAELPPPAWIRWPIRVLAVLFVLPFRLLWELLGLIGRFLARYVGRPLAWLWHYAVAVPAAFLWHYLVAVPAAFLWHWLVVIPATWVWRHALRPVLEWLIVVPARWLWRHRRSLLRPFVVVLRYLLVVPFVWLWAVTAPVRRGLWWVLSGLGRGIAAVLTAGWRGAGWVLWQLYRWVLRPAGLAVAWCWRHTVVPAYRMIAAGGRWVREAILRPAAGMARAVLVAAGLRR
jgi:hypothetical protein